MPRILWVLLILIPAVAALPTTEAHTPSCNVVNSALCVYDDPCQPDDRNTYTGTKADVPVISGENINVERRYNCDGTRRWALDAEVTIPGVVKVWVYRDHWQHSSSFATCYSWSEVHVLGEPWFYGGGYGTVCPAMPVPLP